jgi:hypothetical protein
MVRRKKMKRFPLFVRGALLAFALGMILTGCQSGVEWPMLSKNFLKGGDNFDDASVTVDNVDDLVAAAASSQDDSAKILGKITDAIKSADNAGKVKLTGAAVTAAMNATGLLGEAATALKDIDIDKLTNGGNTDLSSLQDVVEKMAAKSDDAADALDKIVGAYSDVTAPATPAGTAAKNAAQAIKNGDTDATSVLLLALSGNKAIMDTLDMSDPSSQTNIDKINDAITNGGSGNANAFTKAMLKQFQGDKSLLKGTALEGLQGMIDGLTLS